MSGSSTQAAGGQYNLPPPALNGGLYTGAPFAPGAPWANVPALPDAGYYNFVALPRTADPPPPPGASWQVAHGDLNPGNNLPLRPVAAAGTTTIVPGLHAVCVPQAVMDAAPKVAGPPGAVAFRQFAYL